MNSAALDGGGRSIWRRYSAQLFDRAMDENLAQIRRLILQVLPKQGGARLLDLGCWDGRTALRYVPAQLGFFGAEFSRAAACEARSVGIRTIRSDLNKGFPWRSESLDVISSNQVIEHLHDTDTIPAESYRLLRPGGHVIVSTENLASWHNILALMMGWQAFSLTNVSQRASGIGNPLANVRGSEPLERGWEHSRMFSYRGLLELLTATVSKR